MFAHIGPAIAQQTAVSPIESIFFASVAVFLAAAAVSLILVASLRRALPSGFLMAAVNDRSNHTRPARQIGGLGAVPAALGAFFLVLWLAGLPAGPWLALGSGVAVLWMAGFVDDYRPVGALAKLAAQLVAVIIVLAGSDLALPLAGSLPPYAGYIIAAVVLVGFINMVNFMDGLDLITASGAGSSVLFAAALCVAASGNAGAWLAGLATVGALAGFAWHNRPPAPVFLGDAGSLPLGLVAGYLSLVAAGSVSPALALLPFAYYLADTVTTLVKRALERKNILTAHREHAYQVARQNGMPVTAVVLRVAGVGLITGLAALFAMAVPASLSAVVVTIGWLAAFALIVHLRRAAR